MNRQDDFAKRTPEIAKKDVVALGVISGLSNFYGFNLSQMRVAFAIAGLFFFNFAFVLYIVLYGLMRARVPFPTFNLSASSENASTASVNTMLGVLIILMGCGMVFNFLFPWLNAGLMIAVLLVLLGVHFLRHKQAR